MVTSEAINTNDALDLAVEQEVAEQLTQNTREFIAGLENEFNVTFAEKEVAEVMVAKPADYEEEDDEDEDEEGEDEYDDEGSDSGEDTE